MNRLTNKYGAFNEPLGEKALALVREFEKQVRVFIQENNLTPEEIRILSVITNAEIMCAEMILVKAMEMRKQEMREYEKNIQRVRNGKDPLKI